MPTSHKKSNTLIEQKIKFLFKHSSQKWTASAFAQYIGIDRTSLYNVYEGKAKTYLIDKIADVLGVKSEYLKSDSISVDEIDNYRINTELISNGRIVPGFNYAELPFVSVKARAGFIEALSYSQSETYTIEEIYPVLMEPGEVYTGHIVFEIDGDSMEPLFVSKTKVRAKPVSFNDWEYIPSGIYIVNYASTYITIKRVKTNDLIEKGYLELHPENKETAGPQKIRKEDINRIWKVVSVVYAPVR